VIIEYERPKGSAGSGGDVGASWSVCSAIRTILNRPDSAFHIPYAIFRMKYGVR